MKQKTPVGRDVYDGEWIESAWGPTANDRLLSQAELLPRPRLRRALVLAGLEPGQHLLDVACGRGELVAIAAERGVHAVGLDFSPSAIDFARRLRLARQSRFPAGSKMELVRADACRLPFGNNSFDRVTMLDIIEHLVPAQLDSLFREVLRVLKPSGYAVLHTLPNRWVYDFTFPLLNRVSRRFPRDPRGPIDRKIHVNEQDLPTLHRTLNVCGIRHRLWLEQHMPAQARWNRSQDSYGDNRDNIYPILAGATGTMLEIASRTPLKLVLSNDIFGLAWKGDQLPQVRAPLALTERLACCIFSGKQQPGS